MKKTFEEPSIECIKIYSEEITAPGPLDKFGNDGLNVGVGASGQGYSWI